MSLYSSNYKSSGNGGLYSRSYSSVQKPLKTPKVINPDVTAAATVAHNAARLRAIGYNPPTTVQHGNLLTDILDILNRPGAAVRGAIKAMITPQSDESVLGAVWNGLTGRENVTGSDILQAAGLQIPKDKPLSGFLNWALSTGVDILTDPLTYVGIGAAAHTTEIGVEDLAKNISKELATQFSRNISEDSAKLLANNVLRNISLNEAALRAKFPKMNLNTIHDMAVEASTPIGQLGAVVKRALGYEVENIARTAPLQDLEKTTAKVLGDKLLGKNYKSISTTITRLEKAIEKEKVPEGVKDAPKYLYNAQKYLDVLKQAPRTVNIAKTIRPARTYSLELQFLGKPLGKSLVDITSGVNALQKGATALGQKASRVVDLLGKAFIKDYVPINIQGGTRTALSAAKNIISETARKAPAASDIVTKDVLAQWKDIPLDVQRKATYVIEEGMSKEAKNVAKAQKKLAEAKSILQERLKATASKRSISGAEKSVRNWTAKLKTAQEELLQKREANIGSRTISKEVQNAADLARNMFAQDVQALAEHGININTIKDYVYHVFKNTPEEIDKVVSRLKPVRTLSGAKPGFEYARLLKMPISQLKELGLQPIEEVGLTTAIHRAMTTQQIVLHDMARSLASLGTDVIRRVENAPKDWVPIGKDISDKLPWFTNMAVHPEVAEALQRLMPIFNQEDKAISTINQMYKQITGFTKGLMTSVNPSFHVRNALGNIFLNWSDGLTNPKYYADAIKLLKNPKSVELMINGRPVNGTILRRLFEQEGLVGQGAFAKLRGNMSSTKNVISMAEKMGILPKEGTKLQNVLDIAKNAPRQLGETVDTVGRLANFLYHLDKGESPLEAAQAVRRVLYDYGALSPFEQKLRGIVPFYSWVRFNTPAMIKLVATKPGIITALDHAVKNGMKINNISDDEVPQYIKDSLALPLGRTSTGNILYLNWSLPPADLARIHNPDDPTAIGQEILSMLNPVFTVPAQVLSNTNWFTGQQISKNPKVTTQFYKDALNFAIQQLQPAREIANAYKYATEQPNKPITSKHIPGLGTMVTQINPQAVQRSNLYELRDLLQQIINVKKAQGVKVPDWKTLSKQ
jgi:hypothetical protein